MGKLGRDVQGTGVVEPTRTFSRCLRCGDWRKFVVLTTNEGIRPLVRRNSEKGSKALHIWSPPSSSR
ncbi:hypothetical protein IG631_16201 [Alternaria alternata]|nr:hypothetical protein IG631_16201 [Alternaria alternata]